MVAGRGLNVAGAGQKSRVRVESSGRPGTISQTRLHGGTESTCQMS